MSHSASRESASADAATKPAYISHYERLKAEGITPFMPVEAVKN